MNFLFLLNIKNYYINNLVTSSATNLMTDAKGASSGTLRLF